MDKAGNVLKAVLQRNLKLEIKRNLQQQANKLSKIRRKQRRVNKLMTKKKITMRKNSKNY
jgi:hypothetical protein